MWDYTKALIERKVGKKGKEKDAIDKQRLLKRAPRCFLNFSLSAKMPIKIWRKSRQLEEEKGEKIENEKNFFLGT